MLRIAFTLIQIYASFIIVWSACPIEDDPTNLARCVQVDVTALVYAARGKDDLTSLCQVADRYMECFKTYSRGCVGYHFGDGSLTELQNIALYCCKGINFLPDCPFNQKVQRTCIDGESYTVLVDGTKKLVKDLQVGDKVKTLDHNGKLIDTDIIMLMDKSYQKSLFLNIQTYSNKSLTVSPTHLIAVPGGKYKYAKRLFKEDSIIQYDFGKSLPVEEKIKTILIEQVESYAAPLTMQGTLLVNDVLVSSYAVVQSHSLAHTVMAPIRWYYALNNALSNSFHIVSDNVFYDHMNGTHWYPQFLYSLTDQFLTSVIQLN